MLATFNPQLFTPDLGAETPALQGIGQIDGPPEPAGFAALLQLRTADTVAIETPAGDALPPTGNRLPEPDIAITIDGIALDGGGDADIPLLPVADEQPWESLVTPPGLELSSTTPSDVLQPMTILAREQVVSITHAVPVESGPSAEPAATGPIAKPLPATTAELPREFIADARDIRIAPGVQAVAPREIQPREFNAAQVAQPRVQDDGQPVLQDAAARPTAAPSQQAAPVAEQLAEPARPVVQPGVPQATVATAAFQPGAFSSVASAAPQADSPFASALQQQVSGLIETPVREASWGDRIGERVVMMANNQLKTAEIRLTPAELGPVRVQVNVEDGAANITFQAQHAVTREAIEQALPRLREMFAESGLSLGQASVGEQNVAGNRDGSARGEARTTGQGSEFLAADDEAPAEERPTRRHVGLLDTFA